GDGDEPQVAAGQPTAVDVGDAASAGTAHEQPPGDHVAPPRHAEDTDAWEVATGSPASFLWPYGGTDTTAAGPGGGEHGGGAARARQGVGRGRGRGGGSARGQVPPPRPRSRSGN